MRETKRNLPKQMYKVPQLQIYCQWHSAILQILKLEDFRAKIDHRNH